MDEKVEGPSQAPRMHMHNGTCNAKLHVHTHLNYSTRTTAHEVPHMHYSTSTTAHTKQQHIAKQHIAKPGIS